MDSDFKDFIKKTTTDYSKAIVGRILNQSDILKNDKTLTDKQRFELIVKFNRELIYEESRNLRNAITFYLEGRTYTKYPIYNPSKES